MRLRRGPCWSPAALALAAVVLSASPSFAQPAGPAAGSPVLDAARARLQDAETVRTLTDEGRLLYQRERIKLEGYQYCGQAVALAERGEFRLSIQAASKALIIAAPLAALPRTTWCSTTPANTSRACMRACWPTATNSCWKT